MISYAGLRRLILQPRWWPCVRTKEVLLRVCVVYPTHCPYGGQHRSISAPISFSTMPTTAWCSPADAAIFGCRLGYHAAETSFRNDGKYVRYFYNDVSSAANRPRTVSPRMCGRIFPSGSALGADIPSIKMVFRYEGTYLLQFDINLVSPSCV